MAGKFVQVIMKGDDGSYYKRWLDEKGKVKWLPCKLVMFYGKIKYTTIPKRHGHKDSLELEDEFSKTINWAKDV